MSRPIIFGEISGIKEGHWFEGRKEMMPTSFHRRWGSGIDGNSNEGTSAIVLSGGYEDDKDEGDEIIYTGAGGKIEKEEKPEFALERELKEELEMRLTVNEYFKTEIHKYERFTIELIAYSCKFIDANFRMIDHDAYEWVNIKELKNWKLAPADIPIAEELIKNEEIKHNA